MSEDNKYLTLIQAAELLRVTRQWLRKRVKNGTAPAHITVGRRTIFEREAVEKEICERNGPAGGGDR